MGEEFGKVVLRALLADAIGGSDEDIGQEAWLCRRDVGEPAAHGGGIVARTVLSLFRVWKGVGCNGIKSRLYPYTEMQDQFPRKAIVAGGGCQIGRTAGSTTQSFRRDFRL
jgi:hypothetical protein